MKKFTLKREEKLKGHKLVKQLFHQPSIIVEFPFKLFYKWEKDSLDKGLKFGVSVAKRKFKKSPDRNKIKRIIKEAYRLEKNDIKVKVATLGRLSLMISYIGDNYPETQETQLRIKKILFRLQENLKI